jgi:hypothetical protein
MVSLRKLLLTGTAALSLATAARAEAVKHVLLLSVDGLHEVDLRRYVANHPGSALAKLSHRGTTFSNAFTTLPSDSFPGMIAQFTGGTPKSTGVYYDASYTRDYYPAGSNCTGPIGTATFYAEPIDKNLDDITAGGTLGKVLTQIDPAKLPERIIGGVCQPVYPHEFLRVNTVFEVIRNHGGHTAWSDKHPAYEILSGPSGTGIEDLFAPEINAQVTPQVPGQSVFPAGSDYTQSYSAVRAYDAFKVKAVLNQIDGLDSTGTQVTYYTPSIFGMNFQAVSVGQKLAKSGPGDAAGLVGGYLDANGTPGNALTLQLDFIEQSVSRMVAALQLRGIYDETVFMISAKHGQSPIDPAARRAIKDTFSTVPANDGYATDTSDDASLIWLNPNQRTPALYNKALADLRANKTALGINQILAREQLTQIFQNPFKDTRAPDFLIVSDYGVIYTGGSKLAEHGGAANDDRHVALLVSAPGLSGTTVDQTVFTTQIAPTILGALRLSPNELQAVGEEGTQVLPGLSGRSKNGREHEDDNNRR